jgi:hypothetical protein
MGVVRLSLTALLVTGCGSSFAAPGRPADPQMTLAPAVEEKLCVAMAGSESVAQQLMAMTTAADADDYAGVSRHARDAGDSTQRMVDSLQFVPDWPPVREIVGGYSRAGRALSQALDEIGRGADRDDFDLFTRGEAHLEQATEQIEQTTALIAPFRELTGFGCD